MFWLSFLFAVCFVLIHLFSKKLLFLNNVPRSRFLSIAGGIAVAYVFIHLLPDLNEHQEAVEEALSKESLSFLESHIYLIALAGLTLFYGLERMVKVSKRKNNTRKATAGIFWIHIGSFFFYNAIIGYLLITEEFANVTGMIFYFLALAVHFIINDFSLRERHETIYDKYGRWLLSVAVLIGWAIGSLYEVKPFIVSFLTAFLAGGVILNILKEELPEERQSSFGAFLVGVAGYTLLLLII
ncbi:hypothetical protein [Virgibacillus senegalensis]|uniref:hypothetical protein n=1 Tax=Virgibacillus senegalensis TaxID=1499679 RepID=UPI00069E2BD5|nr:hypothetical protein [Virgibacillus senegalensis]